MKNALKILGVIVITIFAVVFFLSWKNQASISPPIFLETNAADTTLSLSPNPLLLTSETGNIDIVMDTGNNVVNFVQIKLAYNPKSLTDIKITKGPFLQKAETLNTYTNENNGTLTYILVLPKETKAVQGKGTIATIAFKTTLKNGESTILAFLKDSLITNDQSVESVLQKTENAKILRK